MPNHDPNSRREAPEARARQGIDAALIAAGWVVQDRADVNLYAGTGVAVRETPTATGPADYLLFLDGRACGVLEAKPEGTTLLGVVNQGADYTRAAPAKYPAWANPLPFVYVSTGSETLFQDARDPQARPRRVFAVHRPATLRAMLKHSESLRARLASLPPLDANRLRPCQAEAIAAVEGALAQGKQRALVSMATGAGKTYTACALTHRLLSPPVRMGRVLFLVDRANLGTQAKREFDSFVPAGAGLLFREEFTVQHLQGSSIDPAASVVISTVQRLYSVLRGEPIDEADDERGGFERAADDVERPVTYSADIPPETFDLIIVDECHRSIYGSWRQVLDYFDAFLVGLTATPGRHTLGFFQQNLVSQYPFERSVADGVNVDFEVWRIRTEVGERGGTIPAGFVVPHRDKETRRRRLAALDEDRPYAANELNRSVENPNQIRTVLQAYRDALPIQLFPGRTEVPKTLIFCLSDPHAETVTDIAREVFDGDARFAQKITYRATGKSGQELIQDFRTDHLFRIATTVDMVATGTDIKPLEVVIFLRDVRSAQYFEQMRGRGARTILPSDLQRATPSAERKDRFIIVDAVGVTESVKTPSEPLERDRTLSLEALLERVAFGHTDEDTCATLAGRLARLERRLPDPVRAELNGLAQGMNLTDIARALVDAVDPVRIEAKLREAGSTAPEDDEAAWDATAAALRAEACKPIAANPALRRAILEAQRQSEIIIDELTPDAVLSADFDLKRATEITDRFASFLQEEQDRLAALSILYARPHVERRLPFLSCNLGAEQPLLDADVIGIGGNRDTGAPLLDTVTVAGQAVVPIDLINFGHWLRLLFGPPTTSGTSPNFIHSFGSGLAALPSNSIEIGYPDVPNFDVCTGVRADTLEMDFTPTGAASATIGLLGQGSLRGAASSGGTPSGAAFTAFNKAQGSITRAGAALAQVTGARISFSNGMETVRTIRADRKVEGVDPGIARCTGQITVRFENTLLLAQAQGGTAAEFAMAFTMDANRSLTITLHEVYLALAKTPIEGPAGVEASFDFRAAFNATAGRMMTVVVRNQQAGAEYG